MRVALVSEFFYPTLGGIQEHLYFFAKELIKMGHEPAIVTPHILRPPPFKEWWPKDLPESIYHPMGWGLPFFVNNSVGRTTAGFFLGSRLKRLLSAKNFDLVHLHSPLNGVLPILANHYASVPVVGTFHTYFPDSVNFRLFRPICQRHIDRLSHIICVSPSSLESLKRIFDIDATIIPNGIDTDFFHPHEEGVDDQIAEYRDGTVNIYFIGRPDPRNGLDLIIQAFADLQTLTPIKTRLMIAGDGDLMPQYKKMVTDLKLTNVVFFGAVRNRRPKLYRTADIHVFQVQRASFSVQLVEGMASGLPVVTTDFEGIRFAGNPGEHFLTTPFGNIEALTRQLQLLIENPELRKKIGQQGRAHALRYQWSSIAEQVVDIYGRVLKQEKGSYLSAPSPRLDSSAKTAGKTTGKTTV